MNLCGKTELYNRQVIGSLDTICAIYVIWQKSCDRNNHHECCFNPSVPSGSREVLYLFWLTSVNLTSFHSHYPFTLEKVMIFLYDIEHFVCNFCPKIINNGSTLLLTELGFCMQVPFVATLCECGRTMIKFELHPSLY